MKTKCTWDSDLTLALSYIYMYIQCSFDVVLMVYQNYMCIYLHAAMHCRNIRLV